MHRAKTAVMLWTLTKKIVSKCLVCLWQMKCENGIPRPRLNIIFARHARRNFNPSLSKWGWSQTFKIVGHTAQASGHQFSSLRFALQLYRWALATWKFIMSTRCYESVCLLLDNIVRTIKSTCEVMLPVEDGKQPVTILCHNVKGLDAFVVLIFHAAISRSLQ